MCVRYVSCISKSSTRELTFSFNEDKENILPSMMPRNIASVCDIASALSHQFLIKNERVLLKEWSPLQKWDLRIMNSRY